jgi:probable addiction module antidote protein
MRATRRSSSSRIRTAPRFISRKRSPPKTSLAFKLALRNVAEARLGGIRALSQHAELNRESLYLYERGNPTLETLTKVMQALGLRISVAVEPCLRHSQSVVNP